MTRDELEEQLKKYYASCRIDRDDFASLYPRNLRGLIRGVRTISDAVFVAVDHAKKHGAKAETCFCLDAVTIVVQKASKSVGIPLVMAGFKAAGPRFRHGAKEIPDVYEYTIEAFEPCR